MPCLPLPVRINQVGRVAGACRPAGAHAARALILACPLARAPCSCRTVKDFRASEDCPCLSARRGTGKPKRRDASPARFDFPSCLGELNWGREVRAARRVASPNRPFSSPAVNRTACCAKHLLLPCFQYSWAACLHVTEPRRQARSHGSSRADLQSSMNNEPCQPTNRCYCATLHRGSVLVYL